MKPITKKAQDKKSALAYEKRHAFQVAVLSMLFKEDVDYYGWGWSVTGRIYDNVVLPLLTKKKVKK